MVKDSKGQWQTRWCELRGTQFASFKNRTDAQPHKVVEVVGGRVEAIKEAQHPFAVRFIVSSGRSYYFATATKIDQSDWMVRMADIGRNGRKSEYLLLAPRSARERAQTASVPRDLSKKSPVSPRGGSGPIPGPAVVPTPTKSASVEKDVTSLRKKRSETSPRLVTKPVDRTLAPEEDAKVEALYEKHKDHLSRGGFNKKEFKRNSIIIMNVMQVENQVESNNKRYSKNEVFSDVSGIDESDSSTDASSSSPAMLPLTSPRGPNFVGKRGSLQFERKHKTLRELCSQEDPTKRFKKMVKIGEGSFGTVFVAVDSVTKNRVAVKKMTITKKNRYHLETELDLHMTSSDHPNVVPILMSYIVQDSKRYEVWAVLEFLENGSLTETLTTLDMKEPDIAYVCKEVAAALSWLHSRNLVHRDIKSDNILLGVRGEVKLADFGLAIELVKGAEKRRSVLGTPFWMSPEIINGKDYDDRVDIWALGVTTIEMMNKTPPYSNYPKTKALFLITSQGVPLSSLASQGKWSPQALDWLAKCLTYDMVKRPNVWTLAEHAFLDTSSSKEDFVRRVIVPMQGKVKQCVIF